jgi:predicted CoA-binding protein
MDLDRVFKEWSEGLNCWKAETMRKPALKELRKILATTRVIAVVGLSDKEDRPSHAVAAYLQMQGYRIIPVNPNLTEVLGEKAYPNVRDIPETVDVVDIFRRAEDIPPIVEDAIAKGAKVVWMQLGIVNEAAAVRAEAAGLKVVMDTCMEVVHRTLRLVGKI